MISNVFCTQAFYFVRNITGQQCDPLSDADERISVIAGSDQGLHGLYKEIYNCTWIMNLLPGEQILFCKSCSLLRMEATRGMVE